jgi:hypothetical protein
LHFASHQFYCFYGVDCTLLCTFLPCQPGVHTIVRLRQSCEKLHRLAVSVRKFRSSCKGIISSLIAENYRRSLEEAPLIPLIFCVEINSYVCKINLDILRVAISRPDPLREGNVGDCELRRCYKHFVHPDPALQAIARKTIIYTRVEQTSPSIFKLQKLTPFWQDEKWGGLWNQRKASAVKHADSTKTKNISWRDELSRAKNNADHIYAENRSRSLMDNKS